MFGAAVVLPVAALLAGAPVAATPERYAGLVSRAVKGDVRTAVAAVVDWSPDQIDEAVKSLAGVDARCDETCRQAAILIHTEAAFILVQLDGAGEARVHVKAAATLLPRVSRHGTPSRSVPIEAPSPRDDFEVHWRLAVGHLYRQFAQPREAVLWYEQALKQHRTHPEALVALGALHEYVAAATERRRSGNSLLHAVRRYEEALAADPAHDEARLRLGRVSAMLGRHEPAARELEHVAAAHPSGKLGAVARLFQGDIAEREKRIDQAITHYRRAVEIEPGLQPAHLALCHALQIAGRGAEATAALHRALETVPFETVHGWNAYHTTLLHGYRDTMDRLWKAVQK
jgi:tetratricopeptide (TPR) repeat protein